MRQFVRKLCLNWVTLHEARQMAKLYRPPNFVQIGGGKRRRSEARTLTRVPVHADVPAVRIAQLHQMTWDDEERRAEQVGKPVARKRIRDTRHFAVDDFLIEGCCRFVRRQTVIQVTDVGRGKKLVSPQAKVIHLQPVQNRRPMETVVFVEMPKKCRRKNLKMVVDQLGGESRQLLSQDRMIRDGSFVEKLLGLWQFPIERPPSRRHRPD